MVVNALYNVVDRIFVGRAVGETALGGLALVMPLMTVIMAFAVLFGIGAANMISMRLGQQRRDSAEGALNNCFWLLLASGLLLTALGLIFLDPLLLMLGAPEGSESLVHARSFMRIFLCGAVFFTMGLGLAHCIRAQGFPTITMAGLLLGAALNVCLVPFFLFVLRMGVEGAALGTVIAQAASTVFMLFCCFSRRMVLRLRPLSVRPSVGTAVQIVSFGSAQFLLQFAMSFVMVIYNFSMSSYGSAELGVQGGGDVALSGMNIVNSVSMLILMPIFGIAQGAQPILGYNYGAQRFGRVMGVYKRAVLAATGVACAGFLLLHVLPDQIVGMFAPEGSPALLGFTPFAMRVATAAMPIIGFQIISANMFVVTGRPKASVILSMMRQVILLVPFIIAFGRIWGLNGVIAAAPAADAISAILTAAMIAVEMRKLKAASR
jgi:Na+-driven multidrug efflux pump